MLYEVTCCKCDDSSIDSTFRQVHMRVKEHMATDTSVHKHDSKSHIRDFKVYIIP